MTETGKIERLGNCSVCGKRADWNSPKVDPKLGLQESPLWCDTCAKKEPRFLLGIKQHLTDGKRAWNNNGSCWGASKRGVVLHMDKTYTPNCAWLPQGSAVPRAEEKFAELLEEHDRKVPKHYPEEFVEMFLDRLADVNDAGDIYCTGCGKIMPKNEVAGRPLFAGANCKQCWEKHLEFAENERKTGHVCRMCREPWSFCCC